MDFSIDILYVISFGFARSFFFLRFSFLFPYQLQNGKLTQRCRNVLRFHRSVELSKAGNKHTQQAPTRKSPHKPK